jgi:hypothetical protein
VDQCRQHVAVIARDHVQLNALGAYRGTFADLSAAAEALGIMRPRGTRSVTACSPALNIARIQYPVNSSVRMSSSSTPAPFNRARIAVTMPGGPHR